MCVCMCVYMLGAKHGVCTIPGLHKLQVARVRAVVLYHVKGRFLPRGKCCLTTKDWSIMVDQVVFDDFIQQNFMEK